MMVFDSRVVQLRLPIFKFHYISYFDFRHVARNIDNNNN